MVEAIADACSPEDPDVTVLEIGPGIGTLTRELADRYRALAATLSPSVIFGGRLAEYKYYDMAPIIEKVMGMWE